MMYVSDELKNRMGKKRSSADIVFEYISRSNAVYNRTTKAHTYLMLGVRELWVIDPATVTIEVRYAAEHKGKPVWEGQSYSPGETAESKVLEGWRVSVDELFEGFSPATSLRTESPRGSTAIRAGLQLFGVR